MESAVWAVCVSQERSLLHFLQGLNERLLRRLHVGVRTGGTTGSPVITQIAEFQAPTDTFGLQLLFDASTRATHRMRPQGADFWALSEALGNQTHSPSFR